MSVSSASTADLVSLATNSTSAGGSASFEVWLALGGLGVLIVGYLTWYFFLRKSGD